MPDACGDSIGIKDSIPALCAGMERGPRCTRDAAATFDFRICHLSVQRTHLHLLVEADHVKALSSGMGGFQIALVRRIHAWLGTCGEVFADRYFATSLRSPAQVRNVLSYILNNWRKHGEDRAERSIAAMDPYSSAGMFEDWRHLGHPSEERWMVPIALPRFWCTTIGWKNRGDISCFARPKPS